MRERRERAAERRGAQREAKNAEQTLQGSAKAHRALPYIRSSASSRPSSSSSPLILAYLSLALAPLLPPSPATMQIKIKNLGGILIPLDVETGDTVIRLKERIEEKEGIPPEQQRLIFGGKALADEKKIDFYNIQAGNTIHLVLALRG